MLEIRIQKIDGQEFVPYKDYLRLKEEKQELEYLWDINEKLKEDNKKLKEKVTTYSEEYGKLREENQKLKSRITELEKCNLNLQEHIDKLLNHKQ